jgi:16S rRNA processing protein RimM
MDDRGHPTGWLRAGRVGRPHGLDGSFHVIDCNPGLLGSVARVTVAGEEREIIRRAGTATRPILRLRGCEARDDAEALRGHEMMVTRDHAPDLDPDEWWAEELVGCSVHDAGKPIGTVARLLALPSCEVLEVSRDGAQELLVPLIGDAVRDVDIARRSIEIDLQFLGEES